MTSLQSDMFQSHPEAMWLYDVETGKLLAVNDAACACYGYAPEELVGRPLGDLRAEGEPGATGGGPAAHPVRAEHRRKDGSRLPVELRFQDLEHQGRPARLVTARDITSLVTLERENRELAEVLEAREQPYRLAARLLGTLEGISDGLFTLDRDARFTFVNRAAGQMLQRGAEDLIGVPLFSVLPEAAGSSFERRCRRAMISGQAVTFEEYFEPLDRWFDVRAYPTPDELVVYVHDATEERIQRDQLQLLETAISRLNDMIMITEADPLDEPGPRIIYINEAFVQRTGYERDYVIGLTPRILQGFGTDRTELRRIRRALEALEPVRSELVNYTRDGRPFRVAVEIVPIQDDAGRASHFVSVQRDVTEQRELEEKLRRSQRLDAVGQLTGGVAHDFNNLLTVILGNADLLVEEIGDDERLGTLALMTRKAAERGAELTRRLLAFARRQALDPNITDVNELLGGMYGLLCRTLGEHIEIVLDQGQGLWPAMVDAPQLESAVLNLCLNARDAMPEGGCLTLATGNAELGDGDRIHEGDVSPGEYVTITVSDTGTGMSSEVVEHVFEPFFTTKDTGKGSGLGLSMVYGFIKQSAGHIRIRSEPGVGTAVILYLPRAAVPDGTLEEAVLAEELEGGSERILLVEDDDIVRSFVCAELESLGYRVVPAANGPEALEALQAGQFDLLFTDVVMPGGMNGLELAEAARKLWADLPVLFTSGYTDDAILDQGEAGAGAPLLHKPYRRVELAAKVRQVLPRRGE